MNFASSIQTDFSTHKLVWKSCELCSLCETRNRVVLGRGSRLPAQVLFIGESPGASEDVLGRPFVGPAGHLLDQIIETVQRAKPFSYAMTNLVACIPLDPATSDKVREPEPDCIDACGDRLREFVTLVQPDVVVCVGKLARAYSPEILNWDESWFNEIIHPAAILRMDESQKGLAIQRTVVALLDIVEELP